MCNEEKPNSESTPPLDEPHTDLQQARYHWQVAQHLGLSVDSTHDIFIDKIRDMETRDRKEAKKMGSKSVSHEYSIL